MIRMRWNSIGCRMYRDIYFYISEIYLLLIYKRFSRLLLRIENKHRQRMLRLILMQFGI